MIVVRREGLSAQHSSKRERHKKKNVKGGFAALKREEVTKSIWDRLKKQPTPLGETAI